MHKKNWKQKQQVSDKKTTTKQVTVAKAKDTM